MAVSAGDLLWTPPTDTRARSQIGRFMDWLEADRRVQVADYDALFRWSVDDLEGFWGAMWDFFKVRSHTSLRRR